MLLLPSRRLLLLLLLLLLSLASLLLSPPPPLLPLRLLRLLRLLRGRCTRALLLPVQQKLDSRRQGCRLLGKPPPRVALPCTSRASIASILALISADGREVMARSGQLGWYPPVPSGRQPRGISSVGIQCSPTWKARDSLKRALQLRAKAELAARDAWMGSTLPKPPQDRGGCSSIVHDGRDHPQPPRTKEGQ